MARGSIGEHISMIEIQDWTSFMLATGSSGATVKIRTQTVRSLTRYAGATTPLKLTRRDVISYLARPIKPWSRVTYWRSIRAWDRWAIAFDYTTVSIIQGVPCPRVPAPVARPIDDRAVTALLASHMSGRARAYVTLALYQALRVHEIAKVRGEHFDHKAGWMLIEGKGGDTKPIPIHPEVSKLAAMYPEEGFWFTSHLDPSQPVDPRAVSATIKNSMIAVGIRATAHQLRDTAATRMQRQVKDLRMTQAMMRHKSVATTEKYVAVSNTALQAAVNAMTWDSAA